MISGLSGGRFAPYFRLVTKMSKLIFVPVAT